MDHPPSPSEDVDHGRARHPIGWLRIVLLLPIYLALAIGLASIFRHTYLEAFQFDGPSMAPTLADGDHFIIDRSAYGFRWPRATVATLQWGRPEVGDVVVAVSPMDDSYIAKRVVAVEGQTLEIIDGSVTLDGRPLSTSDPEPCASGETGCVVRRESFGGRSWRAEMSAEPGYFHPHRVTIPPGQVFLLGDRRDRSNDSRNPRVGTVPVDRIVGLGTYVYYSPDRGVVWEEIR